MPANHHERHLTMRTHENGKIRHPGDMLSDFSGRISLLDALGMATLEAHHAGSNGVEIPEGLARGLVAIAEDFEEMKTAIDQWLEHDRTGGSR